MRSFPCSKNSGMFPKLYCRFSNATQGININAVYQIRDFIPVSEKEKKKGTNGEVLKDYEMMPVEEKNGAPTA